MKCPVCGNEQLSGELRDRILCLEWAYLFSLRYSLGKKLPTKEQFEAMQRKGYLPTYRKYPDGTGREFELTYGHYGWAVDYNWPEIAGKIIKAEPRPGYL
jgi:hypothetical protein